MFSSWGVTDCKRIVCIKLEASENNFIVCNNKVPASSPYVIGASPFLVSVMLQVCNFASVRPCSVLALLRRLCHLVHNIDKALPPDSLHSLIELSKGVVTSIVLATFIMLHLLNSRVFAIEVRIRSL